MKKQKRIFDENLKLLLNIPIKKRVNSILQWFQSSYKMVLSVLYNFKSLAVFYSTAI